MGAAGRMSMFGGYPYPTAGRHHDGGQQPMELTVTIRLDVEVHPAFTEEQLLHDLTLQIATLSEPEPRRKPGRIDRKSTRLNSSHQIISYAVFCLKKKKQKSYQLLIKESKCN